MSGVDKVLAIGQIQPKIMNRFDWDGIGKFIADSGEFPQELTLSDKEVQKLNQQEQQEAAQAQQMQQVQQAADIAGSLPEGAIENIAGAVGGGEQGAV